MLREMRHSAEFTLAGLPLGSGTGILPLRIVVLNAGAAFTAARAWLVLGALLLCFTAHAGQTAMELGFDEANKLYAQGSYSNAAAAYAKLSDSGRTSAAVLYNEGNAWFKAGALGRAIAAYSRALALGPRDPDTLANLQFARERVTQPTAPPGRLPRAFGWLGVNEWTALVCVALWACFSLLTAGEFWPAGRQRLRRYAIWPGAAALGLLVCLFVAVKSAHAPRLVVVVPEAVVRSSPLDEAPSAFTVSDGAEFPVLDTKDAWLQIGDSPKRTGWIKADAVACLGRLRE